MDGTLYKGDKPIPGAREFVAELRSRGIPFRFLTNNSSRPCSFFSNRLKRLGFEIEEKDVLSSVVATARFLKEERQGAKVFVIATPEVEKEFESLGIKQYSGDNLDVVLLTFDTSIDYAKINKGFHHILNGAELIATHPDDVCPTENSYDVDIGPFIRLYESLAGIEATIIGKPSKRMLEMAAREMDVKTEDVIMIGDRLSTDIKMGDLAGTRTILVMSGETDGNLLRKSQVRPTFVADSVSEIFDEIIDRKLI